MEAPASPKTPPSEASRRGLSNQRRGREAEWKVRDALVAAGWTVVRAAGSLGVADLLALRRGVAGTRIVVVCALVQVKTLPVGTAEWNDLLLHATTLGAAQPVLATVRPRKPIRWERLFQRREPHSPARPAVEWMP